MIIDVFALMCGLAVVAFAATANNRYAWHFWLAGFLTAAVTINPAIFVLPWDPLLGFDVTQFAMLILLVSCWVMNNYHKAAIPVFMAGALTVIWASVLNLQGLPIGAGILFTVTVSLLCLWASLHRKGFSDRTLEDEANILVLGFALVLVIIPATLSGWESAVVLQDRDQSLEAYRENVPVVIAISGLFILLGGFYAGWKHR